MIKDSGNRRKFDTGAVRDIQEGKGRCDLLPLDVLGKYMGGGVLDKIDEFMQTGDLYALWIAFETFQHQAFSVKDNTLLTVQQTMFHTLLEVSKHFEEGCKKYGDNNWRKGIPARCYIDSAVRHYLKHKRGDTDEPHDRAFCWNILCCIWTCIHKPELNDYKGGETV